MQKMSAVAARHKVCSERAGSAIVRHLKTRYFTATRPDTFMAQKRTAFFISDRTGITAEMLGHSLLTQFESVGFEEVTLPFVDSVDKAHDVVRQINGLAEKDGVRPIVISTLVNTEIASIVATANALFLDSFEIFIAPLEQELDVKASHAIGRSHSTGTPCSRHCRTWV